MGFAPSGGGGGGGGGAITGAGTANKITKFTAATVIGDSSLSDDGVNVTNVGASFSLDVATGNIVKLNNVATSFPAVQGAAGTFLQNDGAGNLTWVVATASVPWSSITNPAGNLALSMAAFTTTFTWNAATGAGVDLFKYVDTAANTGTGRLVNIATAAGSVLRPFRVAAAGVEAIFVDQLGQVGMGTTSPGAVLHVTQTGTNVFFDNASAAAGNGSQLVLRRSRGTVLVPTNISNGDRLGAIIFQGYDGGFTDGGCILCLADAALGVQVPTRLEFCTSTATTSSTTRMTIKNTGEVGIGTGSPGALLEIAETASTGTVLPVLKVTDAANTALTASTERFSINFDLSATQQWATGALGTQRFFQILSPTIDFVAASVTTSASTVSIDNCVRAAANCTITTSHALFIQSTNSVSNGGTVTNARSLSVLIPTGGTNNIAIRIPSAPQASANTALLAIGGATFDGVTAGFFVGSANGTDIGVNAAAGFTGNLIDLQVAGVSKFKVDATGKLTLVGQVDPPSVLLSGGTALFYESNDGQTAPVSGAATGRLRYNNVTGTWQSSVQGGAYADFAGGGGGSTAWSSLTAPTGNLSIAMAAFTTTFTWNAVTGASNLFTMVDTLNNTGTGYILTIGTASGSTAKPFRVQAKGSTTLDTDGNGMLTVSPVAATGTVSPDLTVTAAANTVLTASTERFGVNFNLSATVQFSTGAIATQREFVIQAPTYGFIGASVVTNAATFAITGAPIAGTNATLTNSYALWVQSGTSEFDAPVIINNNSTAAFAVGQNGNTNPALRVVTNGASSVNGLSVTSSSAAVGVTLQTISSNATDPMNLGCKGLSTINFQINNGTRASIASATVSFNPGARSAVSTAAFTWTGATDTNLTTGTESFDVNWNLSHTVQWATGAIATQRAFVIQAPTYGFVGASTITTAATFAITNSPTAGTNATLTNTYALWVQAGISEFDAAVQIKSASATSFVVGLNGVTNPAFQVDSSTGSQVSGVKIIGSGTGGTPTIDAIDSGANTNLSLRAKGSGSLNLTTLGSGTITFNINGSARATMATTTMAFTPGNRSTTSTAGFSYTGGTDTALTASTDVPIVSFNMGQTKTFANGAKTIQRSFVILAPTDAFTSAPNTITDDATFAINSAPLAGTNATITNAHAALIQAGVLTGTITNSYGLTVNAQTGATNNYAAQFLGGNVGIGTATPAANLSIASTAATGTVNPVLLVTDAAHTALTASTERNTVNINDNQTFQWATGAITLQRFVRVQQPTIAFVGASTVTDAATVYIDGAPVAGTNATLTNSWALYVNGATKIAGKLTVTGGIDPTFLELAGSTANTYLNFTDGSTVPLSAASQARIRLNGTTLEFSVNGAAYQAFGSGGGTVTGSGSANTVSKWTSASAIGNSTITDDATTVTINALTTTTTTQFAISTATTADSTAMALISASATGKKALVLQAKAGQTANIFEAQKSDGTVLSSIDALGMTAIAPSASTGTLASDLTITGAANTALTAATERFSVNFNLSAIQQFASNTAVATQRAFVVQAPTYSFASATGTITTAATLAITGAPTAGTNAIITTALALFVQGGKSEFDADVIVKSNTTTALTVGKNGATNPVLTVDASSGTQATGVRILGAATGGTTIIDSTDSGGNTGLKLRSKGNGNITVDTGGATGTTSLQIGGNDKLLVGNTSFTFTPAARSAVSTVPFKFTSPSEVSAALTANTEVISINWDLSTTIQFATVTTVFPTQRFFVVQAPTMSFVGSSTVTDAATCAITGGVVKGANAIVTNSYALLIQAGAVSTAGNSFGLSVSHQTGATLNTAIRIPTAPQASASVASLAIGSGAFDGATSGFFVGSANGTQIGVNAAAASTTNLIDLQIGGVSKFLVGPTSHFITPSARSAVSTPFVKLTTPDESSAALTASTEAPDVDFNLGTVHQWATGALTTQRFVRILAPTIAFAGSSTVTTAATFAISGAPTAGSNATITNPLALWVQAGISVFGGKVGIGSTSNTAANDLELGGSCYFHDGNDTNPFQFHATGDSYGGGGIIARITTDAPTTNNFSFLSCIADLNGTPEQVFGIAATGAMLYHSTVNIQNASYGVLSTDSGSEFTNEGASSNINFTLPTAVKGLVYTFIVEDPDGLTVVANTGDTIRLGGSVSASAGNAASTTVGSVIRIVAINATEWVATSIVGTWSVT